jgi:ABC-type multidrug transport system fused ATPase/permease subunit
LVFDEATSAVDHETEQAVMEAIEGLSADLTILIIALRLTAIKNCA